MCVSPIRIKNPNHGIHVSALTRKLYDCDSQYINVPCRHCSECIAVEQMSLVQRALMESFDCFLYFTTLTYDNEHLPSVLTSTGYRYNYADISHLQLLFKRLRAKNAFSRPFRYLAVSERGSKHGRPHFHVLFFLPRYAGEDYTDGLSLTPLLYNSIKDLFAVNVGSDKYPIYEPLFTFQSKFYRGKKFSNYDTHFVVPSLTTNGYSSCAFYITKYMYKQSPHDEVIRKALKLNLDVMEYRFIYNLVRSRAIHSKSFGLGFKEFNRSHIINYLKECVSRSDTSLGYPQFFNPDNFNRYPLCKFYRSNEAIYSYFDADNFYKNLDSLDDFKCLSDCLNAESRLNSISSAIESDLSLQFNFLFE